MSKTWKAFELTVAKFFNTNRTPLSGSNSRHDTTSDTLHPTLYIEAKRDRRYVGKTLGDLLHNTVKEAKKEHKTPVVALREHSKRGFWLIINSFDFEKVVKIYNDQLSKKL